MQWEPRPETGPAGSHGGQEDRAEEEEAWRTPGAHLINESKPGAADSEEAVDSCPESRDRCRLHGSTLPRSARAPALPAAGSSLHPNPSTQTCSAERPRSTTASRVRPAACPPPRACSPRRNNIDLRVTVNLTWSMKISRTSSACPWVLPWIRGPGAASPSKGLDLYQERGPRGAPSPHTHI
eukprot:bmy_01031T0